MRLSPMRLSVVIPLHDKAPSIRATLDSVLAQSFGGFEVLVIDDGSTDGGGTIAASIGDRRIRVVRQENCGAASARNAGLRLAAHPHVAFLDGDDRWRPDHLATLARLIRTFPGAGLYATGYRFLEGGRLVAPRLAPGLAEMAPGPLGDFFHAGIRGEMPFNASCACVDTRIALGLGGFKPGLRHGEDLDMWARLALRHPVVYDPTPTALYRLGAENRMARRMPALLPWAFRADVERAVAAGALGHDRAALVREYCARVDLFHARGNLLNPDRRALRRFLDGIDTTALAARKRLLRACTHLPPPALAAMLAGWDRLKPLLRS